MNITWEIIDNGTGSWKKIMSFSATGEAPEVIEEFKIPSVVERNQILGISETMRASFQSLWVKGVKEIKKLIVEDGIEHVDPWAFSQIPIKIDEFYWPSTCTTIPHSCFYSSAICGIKGIDNVSTIEPFAFGNSKIVKIVWPAKCYTIPKGCFFDSNLKEITGIESLEAIKESAFSLTDIGTFVWPSKCKVIPESCFFLTPIKEINNIEHVTQIGRGAFKETSIIKFTWPSKCKAIPAECFNNAPLEEFHGIEVVKRIGPKAFGGTSLKEIIFAENSGILEVNINLLASLEKVEVIDLSKVAVVNFINTNSEVETSILFEKIKDKLRLPYYVAGI